MIDEVWTIVLGAAVGPFRLGDSIAEVLHALKSRLPVRPFEVIYDATEPYKHDVIVDSAEDGMKLVFDPVRQILTKIVFYELNRVALKFGRVVIFGGTAPATFMSVYNLFGPTFPGRYEPDEKSYYLGYDGGCITFPIPAEYSKLYQNKTDLPLEFPNGSTPAATGFMVFSGGDDKVATTPQPTRRYYYEEVEVDVGDSTAFSFKGRKQQIQLGSTPQDVLSELGPPVSVFRKSEDPDDSTSLAGGIVGSYFHNYPHLGLDVMYDSLHTVSKVILRTNALGHPSFGAYQKCNFRLCFLTSSVLQRTGLKKTRIPDVRPETLWKDIQKTFGCSPDQRPVVQDDGLGLHPFGSTLCYTPIPGCTFEVMRNGHIASVTLYVH